MRRTETASGHGPQAGGTPTAPEIWAASVHVPGRAVDWARAAEKDGFDGLSFGDTQHVAADPFVGLALAARETERLGLLVGVTNPVTRHPAVTAAAIATVQVESGGRAVLGVGRGDSSLAHLGRPPATVETTERFLEALQRYLRGEAPETDEHFDGAGGAPGGAPGRDRRPPPNPLGWVLATGQPKVPVDVAATGARTLAVGARQAERVTVNVGAIPERVTWAIGAVRRATPPGRPPPSIGAYLVVAAHPDPAVARDLARGPLGAYAHFPGMSGAGGEALGDADRQVVQAVARDYDLAGHGRRHGRHVSHLHDDFVERYAVVGSPLACAERLRALVASGLERVVLVEGSDPSQPAEQRRAHRLLVEEVLPALRSSPSGVP